MSRMITNHFIIIDNTVTLYANILMTKIHVTVISSIDSYLFINLTVDFLYHELFDLVYNSNYLSMM